MADKNDEKYMKMIEMYKQIYNELNENIDNIGLTRDKTNDLRYKIKERNILSLIEDVEYILQSIVYLELSCKCSLGIVKNKGKFYFTFSTFYRNIINTMSIVLKKMDLIIKVNKITDKNIVNINGKIRILIKKELEWRNRMEHGVDPFYCGEHQDILDELSINKIIKIVNMVDNYIYMIIKCKLKIKDFKKVVVKTDVIPLENRKIIIHNSNETFLNLSTKITKLSYITQKDRMLSDLGTKIKELHSVLVYVYDKDRKIMGINNRNIEHNYKYFMRMAIVIYYQIFDKIGYYLSYKFNLRLKEHNRYFKMVRTELKSNKLIEGNNSIFEEETYKKLSNIRKCLVHNKNTFIDYNNDWEKISSLIVVDYERVQGIIYNLYIEYFENNGISSFKNAENELKRNLKKIRL